MHSDWTDIDLSNYRYTKLRSAYNYQFLDLPYDWSEIKSSTNRNAVVPMWDTRYVCVYVENSDRRWVYYSDCFWWACFVDWLSAYRYYCVENNNIYIRYWVNSPTEWTYYYFYTDILPTNAIFEAPTNLIACQSDLATATWNLVTCQSDLATATWNLATCQEELEERPNNCDALYCMNNFNLIPPSFCPICNWSWINRSSVYINWTQYNGNEIVDIHTEDQMDINIDYLNDTIDIDITYGQDEEYLDNVISYTQMTPTNDDLAMLLSNWLETYSPYLFIWLLLIFTIALIKKFFRW